MIVDLPSNGPRKKRTFGDCEACHRGKIYKSPTDAVKHVHDRHFDCTTTELKDRLHDDPCIVWIKGVDPKRDKESKILLRVQKLIEYLSNVSGLLNEIQWLVASSGQDVRSHTSRPRLPSSLVYAFEALLSYYILTSRQLSLVNRSLRPRKTSRRRMELLAVRLRRVKQRCQKVGLNVTDLLAKAKTDILLRGTKDQEEDSLEVQVVGAEFLVAALVTVVQNRSTNIPDEGAVQSTTTRSTDVVDMYKKYSSQIRFEANRRPQRRVMVAIHQLEEELRALYQVLGTQGDLLSWCIDPSQSQFENDYIQKQCDRLFLRIREIERLQKNAEALKLDVGWMIDILEEDHGKAIRVFTIVTLFFLPLCVYPISFTFPGVS